MKYWLVLFFTFCFSLNLIAESPNEDDLHETQATLKDTAKRNEIILKDPKAREADLNLKNLVGSGKELDEAYTLAADLMNNLAKQNSGSPEKMQQALEKALTDPEGFANSFTPEQKKRLKEIASKAEKNAKLP